MNPELVVKLKPAPAAAFGVTAAMPTAPASTELHDLLLREGLVLAPVRSRFAAAAMPFSVAAAIPETLSRRVDEYWTVHAEADRLPGLRERLAEMPEVAAAFIVPAPEVMWLSIAAVAASEARTPDFRDRQAHLDTAPAGIDAAYAWTLPGGRGEDIRLIDIEGDWILNHEKLAHQTKPTLCLLADPAADWQGTHDGFLQHGTAVLGELVGAEDGSGTAGIAPAVELGVVSHMHREPAGQLSGPATAIANATDRLRPGDVMLLEMHMPGPRFGFAPRADQLGYIAVEWWEHIAAAIKDAAEKGIIVVEAGGNGRENLDDALYSRNSAGFSKNWRNPFGRETDRQADSGAVIVGAGAPPSGAFGLDRSRLDFSNHGATFDGQGWGRGVVTTGYGDLQDGADQTRWYTAQFAGTSSASPIVAGALACVQGVLRARGLDLLSPQDARDLLRRTGSPQQWAAGVPGTDRIGSRPDLRALIRAALGLRGVAPA